MLHRKQFCFVRVLAPALAVTLLLLAVIPILLVGDCAHPFGDDYAYSVFVHQAMEQGESVLTALLYTIKRYFFGWQGTYTAAALMALQPGIWSEQAYLLTPVVMLAILILPTARLTHTLFRRWLNHSRVEWICFTALFLLVTVLFQPSTMQAFYWWNGAVYYTFFFGLMLLLIDCIIRLRLEPVHPRLLFATALVLAVLIGGGNFVTGLFSCLLTAGCTLLYLIWDRRRMWQPLILFAVLAVCFLINALAPGNAVRQASSVGMSIPVSILTSLVQVLRDTYHWLNLVHIGFFLCLIPLLWQLTGDIPFRFPWPIAVSILLFLALACQNTPHFFALATEGPGRLRNIVYDAWLWLLCLGEAYWIGWLRHKLDKKKQLSTAVAKILVFLGLILMLAGIATQFSGTSTGQCVQALEDGSAYSYDEHINGWIDQFTTSGNDKEICPALTDFPPLLYLFNLTDNPEEFANIAAANYYGKTSIIALPSE